ncbi:MAG: 30S ribosomal protein S4 [Christensenellales bacterium]|jgi:small subunit ribosomal protein S4
MAKSFETKTAPTSAEPMSAEKKAREQRGPKKRISQYGLQLKAKQLVKRTYGLREKQFKKYYEKALKSKGVTGEEMLVLLERRLDNVIYRMGLGSTRRATRQIVSHGHICVNGKNVNIPSYLVSKGDVISVKENKKDKEIFKELKGMQLVMPSWVEFDTETLTGKVVSYPTRDQIDANFEEHLIIELYSR